MKKANIFGVALVAFTVVGCAVTRITDFQADKAHQYAREVLRDCPQYEFVPFGSKGEKTDAMVLRTRAVTGHPSVPAEDLAQTLNAARTRSLCIVITGVSSGFTARITAEALSLSKGQDLRGLRLLFVGDEADKGMVQQAVEARGGTFYFRPQ